MKKIIIWIIFFVLIAGCKNNNMGSETADYLFSLKNQDVNNMEANQNIGDALEISAIGDYRFELSIEENKKVLSILFDKMSIDVFYIYPKIEEYLSRDMKMNAIILLALIEELDEVRYMNRYCDCVYPNNMISLKLEDLNSEYSNIKEAGKTAKDLHTLLVNIGYYNKKDVDEIASISVHKFFDVEEMLDDNMKNPVLTIANENDVSKFKNVVMNAEKKEAPEKPKTPNYMFELVDKDNRFIAGIYVWLKNSETIMFKSGDYSSYSLSKEDTEVLKGFIIN